MALFDDYKPLRNLIRQTGLNDGLYALWAYTRHTLESQPLPRDCLTDTVMQFRHNVRRHLHPWVLDVLSREVLLHAAGTGKASLRMWQYLHNALNHLIRLDDASFLLAGPHNDVLLHMHRLAHQQFPWQLRLGPRHYTRALKVFGAPAVDVIVEREFGLGFKQCLLLGMAACGAFNQRPVFSTDIEIQLGDLLGVPADATRAFYNRLKATPQELRAQLQTLQTYDAHWLYTWNPLAATPLVQFDPAAPARTLCPITRHLFNRTTTGLYYDLIRQPGFDQAFGAAFQAYIGEVLAVTCAAPEFYLRTETPYTVAGNRHDGVDWLLSDSTGHLLIECKTKRITVPARGLTDESALDRDLDAIARALVQLYSNLDEVLKGLAHWTPNQLPCYVMIVTLEEWYWFSPTVRRRLEARAREVFAERRKDPALMETYPYAIASAADLEVAGQIIGQHGIHNFLSRVVDPDRWGWSLMPIAQTDFKASFQSATDNLFPEVFESLIPDDPRAVSGRGI